MGLEELSLSGIIGFGGLTMFNRRFSYFAALIFSVPAAAKQTVDVEPLDVDDRLARAKALIEKWDQPSDFGGVTRDAADPNKVSWLNFQNFQNFRNFQNFANFRNFQNFQNFQNNFSNFGNAPRVEAPPRPPVQTFNNFSNAPRVEAPPPAQTFSNATVIPHLEPRPLPNTAIGAPVIPHLEPRPLPNTAIGAPVSGGAQPPSSPSAAPHLGPSQSATVPIPHLPPAPNKGNLSGAPNSGARPGSAFPGAASTSPNQGGQMPHPAPAPTPTPPNFAGSMPHPPPQILPSPGGTSNAGLASPNSQSPPNSNSVSGQPAPGAISVGQYQVGGKTYQYAFCSSQGACEYWNSATDGVMTVNGQIVGGQGQSAAALTNPNAPPTYATNQINQAIGQLNQGLIDSMMQSSPPDVPTPPAISSSTGPQMPGLLGSQGADAVLETPSGGPAPPQSNYASSVPENASPPNYSGMPDQVEQNISDNTTATINQYQQNSLQFIDDINNAIDTYDNLKEIKEGVDAFANGEFDTFVNKNIAAATYQGITGSAIDAAVPKNGDPVQDSMNDFLQILNRLSQTPGATLSDAVDRSKTVFQGLTGNFKANLDWLSQQIEMFR
jgi:hypothetical protein